MNGSIFPGAQKSGNRSQRNNTRREQRLAEKGIQQGALAPLELAEYGKMKPLFGQPLLEFANPPRRMTETFVRVIA